MFSDEQLNRLRKAVGQRLSEKRYLHVLGVEEAATVLGGVLLPDSIPELRAAALLHDISKEMTNGEAASLIRRLHLDECPEDLLIPAVYHSLTAPAVIRERFPEFATDHILSAVKNHTTGDSDMSLFDKIIYISDYIEKGRTHPVCIETRDYLLRHYESDAVSALDYALIMAIEGTIAMLEKKGGAIHPRTLAFRQSLISKDSRA